MTRQLPGVEGVVGDTYLLHFIWSIFAFYACHFLMYGKVSSENTAPHLAHWVGSIRMYQSNHSVSSPSTLSPCICVPHSNLCGYGMCVCMCVYVRQRCTPSLSPTGHTEQPCSLHWGGSGGLQVHVQPATRPDLSHQLLPPTLHSVAWGQEDQTGASSTPYLGQ